MEVIRVRDIEYKLVKARDFEVIVRSDNGFINYTKLCQQINDNRRPFKELKKSETFKYLCIQMEEPSERIRSDGNELSLYEQIKEHIEIEITGGDRVSEMERIRGTYMPRYLLDYVIMTCDICYYKLIHELMDVIDQASDKYQRSFISQLQLEINTQRNLLAEKETMIAELRESNARIERQNEQLQETIDELYNMNLTSTQDVSHLRRDVGYLTQDMHDVSNAIAEVNERVGVLSINNQKLNTVHDVFIIYFSESKPSDIDKRNDCEDDEIWLSTYNGQLSNYRRSVPNDAYLLYQIDSNRLDSFKFITENEVLEEYILDIYQRNIKIYIPSFHRFIDEINRLMNADGKYEVVRNLQVINERIKNNNRQHQEQRAETDRKRQLLEQYNDLHININRYKRRVYAKVNENSYRLVNEFDEASNYPWIYRYGTNGSKSGEISMLLLTQDIFTNDHDTRIRYE